MSEGDDEDLPSSAAPWPGDGLCWPVRGRVFQRTFRGLVTESMGPVDCSLPLLTQSFRFEVVA